MQLELYGPLRRYGPVTLTFTSPPNVRAAKEALSTALPAAKELIARSAFGDDEHVLTDEDVLDPNASYAVLPPVAGG